jgi:hypothetical protein
VKRINRTRIMRTTLKFKGKKPMDLEQDSSDRYWTTTTRRRRRKGRREEGEEGGRGLWEERSD